MAFETRIDNFHRIVMNTSIYPNHIQSKITYEMRIIRANSKHQKPLLKPRGRKYKNDQTQLPEHHQVMLVRPHHHTYSHIRTVKRTI